MKRVLILALMLTLAGAARAGETNATQSTDTNAPASGNLTDDQLGDLLQQAILLARVGLYDEAVARCQQILQQKPDQPTVKQLLGEIQEKRRQVAPPLPGIELRGKLQDMIVPELNVREAAAADVIEFLRAESKKLTQGIGEVNFVWQVPAGQQLPKVTLNLKNVPMLDAIRYVTELAKLRYRVDEHAVVVYPPEGAEAAPGASTPADSHGQP